MKYVIDISEQRYRSLQECAVAVTDEIHKAVLNGTPLPKGHGRIGDLDRVENIVCDEFVDLQDGSEEWRTAVNDAVENILHKVHYLPVIIEADKGEDNEDID